MFIGIYMIFPYRKCIHRLCILRKRDLPGRILHLQGLPFSVCLRLVFSRLCRPSLLYIHIDPYRVGAGSHLPPFIFHTEVTKPIEAVEFGSPGTDADLFPQGGVSVDHDLPGRQDPRPFIFCEVVYSKAQFFRLKGAAVLEIVYDPRKRDPFGVIYFAESYPAFKSILIIPLHLLHNSFQW